VPSKVTSPSASRIAATEPLPLSTSAEIELGTGLVVSKHAKERQNDQEVDEVVGGQNARREDIVCLPPA